MNNTVENSVSKKVQHFIRYKLWLHFC